MEFISNFWPAYVPVGIVLVAAVIELVADARKRRMPRPSPDLREHAPARAVVFYMAWPRASAARRSVPAGAMPGRVISLDEARRRRARAPGESGTRRSRA
jgi:hypothetical protein